jgi:hypothetical protein
MNVSNQKSRELNQESRRPVLRKYEMRDLCRRPVCCLFGSKPDCTQLIMPHDVVSSDMSVHFTVYVSIRERRQDFLQSSAHYL